MIFVTKAERTATVQASLTMDTSVKSAKGHMKLFFVEYCSLLRTNDIKWVSVKTPKVAVRHVLSAVKPVHLS